MKQTTFNILFFIAKKRLMKNGDAPVYLRITVNGLSEEIRIKRSIAPNLWNQAKSCSRGKDRDSLELNEYIRSLNLKLLTIHKELTLEELPFTARILKNKLFGLEDERGKTILGVFKEHNEKCRQLIGIDFADITVRRYDNCAKYIAELIKTKYDRDDLSLKEINAEFVRDFEFYMKVNRGSHQNTVIRYMKCLKKLINLSLANDWMAKNPFATIKFKEVEVVKEFLTKEELEIIIKKEFDMPRLDLVRDIFLFCTFTGLAFVDAMNLKAEHLVKDNQDNPLRLSYE